MKVFVLILSLISLNCFGQDTTEVRVYFETGKYAINSENESKIRDFFKDTSSVSDIQVSAHTDHIGDEDANKLLSEQRRDAVLSVLRELNLNDVVSSSKAHGEGAPLGSDMRDNRCVVIQKISTVAKAPESEEFPTEVGGMMIFEKIQFVPGTAELVKEAHPEIENLVKTLEDNRHITIEVGGHVCCGSALQLSIDRAKKVYDQLVMWGIPQGRLSFKGYDNTMPIAVEDSPENMQKNRRVEIKITSTSYPTNN